MASLQAIVHREGLRIRILEFHSAPFKGVHLENEHDSLESNQNCVNFKLTFQPLLITKTELLTANSIILARM